MSARKILYIHMAALGDGLMASPGLALLKKHLPDRRLVVVSREHVAGYFKRLDFVDEVEVFGSNRFLVRNKPWLALGVIPDALRLLGRLKNGNYEAALQWRGQFPDTVMSVATGADHRLASRQFIHRRPWWPVEKIPGTGIEMVDATRSDIHMVEAMAAPCVRLIEKVTGKQVDSSQVDWRLRFPIQPAEQLGAEKFMREEGLERGGFAIVSISSKTVWNQWPDERFAEVAQHLQEKCGLRVVIDALPGHKAREDFIVSKLKTPPVRAAGRLGLGEIAYVIGQARMVVCYNSAPMHFCAVSGTPVVVIGGRDGADIAPWNVPNRVVSGNEFYPRRHPDQAKWPELVGKVSARDVCAASTQLLKESP